MSNKININRTRDGLIRVPNMPLPAGLAEKGMRIDALLKGIDRYLELMFIPPENRGILDTKPWAVVHRPPNMPEYYVLYAEDADERLLARVLRADTSKTNVLSEVEALNKAREAMNAKEQADRMAESHALAYSIWNSPKIHYKHGGVDFGAAL